MGAFRITRGRGTVLQTLNALTLDTLTAVDTVASGSLLANIGGQTSGSTITISPSDGRFSLNAGATQLLRGLSAWSDGTISLSLTETKVGYTTRTTIFSFVVTAPGSMPSLSPGAGWTGVAKSGGVPAVFPSGNVASDPITRTTAKPAIHWLVPSDLRVVGSRVYGVDADCSGTAGGSLFSVKQVVFHLEGNEVTVTTPSFYTDTDANGASRTRWGYWINVVTAATAGEMRLFATAVPNDATMQNRVIGFDHPASDPTGNWNGNYPMSVFPRAVANDWSKTVRLDGTGDYTTLLAAIDAAAVAVAGGVEAPLITITQTGSYEPTNTARSQGSGWPVCKGFGTITHAPGVTATIGRASAFTANNAASWTWTPGLEGLEFRGSGIVFDQRNWTQIVFTTKAAWFNGCKFTNSIGTRDSFYWNGVTNPFPGTSLESYYDNVFIEYVSGQLQAMRYAQGCQVRQVLNDIFSGTHYVAGNYVRGWDGNFFQPELVSLTVAYSGAGGALTSATVLAPATGTAGNNIVLDAASSTLSVQAATPTTFTSTSSSISGTTLTVGGSITGSVTAGQFLTGAGIAPGTVVTGRGTGTGGAGTYTVSQSQSLGSIAIAGSTTSLGGGATGIKASGAVYFSAQPAVGDRIITGVISGTSLTSLTTWTWVSGTPGAGQIQIGASVAASLANFVSAMAGDANLGTTSAGSAGVTKVGSGGAGNTFTLRVDGVAVLSLTLGTTAADATPNIQAVADAINTLGSGWSATVPASPGRGLMVAASLGGENGSHNPTNANAFGVTVAITSAQGIHADWWQGYSGAHIRENVILRNNICRADNVADNNSFLFNDDTSNGGYSYDHIVKGNIWTGTAPNNGFSGAHMSHYVFENNTAPQMLCIRHEYVNGVVAQGSDPGDQVYSSYKNNIVTMFVFGYSGTGTNYPYSSPWVNNVYAAQGGYVANGPSDAGNVLFTASAYASLFVDYANGDFRPAAAGTLLGNLKPKVNPYDGRQLAYAANDIVGAWAATDPAPSYPF